MPRARALIIGLDGATLDVAGPWMDAGHLPVLATIRERGVCTPLTTTLPASSPAAWSTFATGTNPGKHGILTFAQLFEDSYEPVFINASFRRGATFWELASRQGTRCVVMNVPCTYPPRPYGGVLLACMLSPGVDRRMASPPEALDDLLAFSPHYQVDVSVANRMSPKAREAFVERALATLEGCRQAALGFYRKHRPDLFCVVFTSTDRVSHYFLPERMAQGDDEGRKEDECADAVLQVYRRADEAVGQLIAEAGPDTDVVILSDHGTAPIRKCLSLRRALAEAGLLVERRPGAARRLAKGALLRLVHTVPKAWQRRLISRFGGLAGRAMSTFTSSGIDFARSRAYPADAAEGVFVNLRGRQPLGLVRPGREYEETRQAVMAALSALKDPETGRPVAKGVYRREEVWSGPCLERLPDVVMEQAEWCYDTKPISSAMAEGVFSEPRGAGRQGLYDRARHSRTGLLLAMGPHIRRGSVSGARIADVPATVLALLGCPVPADFDGRVLSEILTDDVAPAARGPAAPAQAAEAEGYAERDRQAVERRLEGLGYL
jgi:predicted AlkP superfamily phosphohydrolase/phosphomutase